MNLFFSFALLVAVLTAGFIFAAVVPQSANPCRAYADTPIKDVPAKCINRQGGLRR